MYLPTINAREVFGIVFIGNRL